ncbi:MAG: hypothetical protein ACD_41C00194G0002 [uncultured bacterium]|nr:MAG: hypothetical protein ACD_41C00194G0002 [uncultured bacterium]
MNSITRFRQLIVPACTLLILSSTLALAWQLYTVAYVPLFGEGNVIAITTDDYTLPQNKLDTILKKIEEKQDFTVDVTTLRNPFVYRP